MYDVRYPTVDRSDFRPNFTKRDDDDHIDIAYGEGVFSDGRPFRVEFWAANQTSFLTYYFSSAGIQNLSAIDLKEYLKSEQAIEFLDDKYLSSGFTGINVSAAKNLDASEKEIWEIAVIVGDEDGTYVRNVVKLRRYDR